MRLDRTAHADVVLLRLMAGKANAIGDEFLASLGKLLDEALAARPRALVVTGHETFFSAGLDLPSLIERDRDAMRRFILHFETTMQRVYTLPLPVVAAVNGHAIAGGCVLALQADVRLAADADKAKVGLNELAIGIGLPPLVLESLRAQVPAASLVPIALEGRLVAPREAAALGLVHEVVPAAELETRAADRAHALAALNPVAFAQAKAAIRAPAVAAAAAGSVEPWLDTWFSEEGRRALTAAVARLRR
jgi:enoyl-CoA hydratase